MNPRLTLRLCGWCSATIARGIGPATYGICGSCYERLARNATRAAWFDAESASSATVTRRWRRTPDELLWKLEKNHGTWSCELWDHGARGVEVRILRNGRWVIGCQFDTKALAVQWAELERRDLGEA
jgi:hypothetical protein